MKKETGRLKATDDDGTVYTIIEYRAVVKSAHLTTKQKGEPAEILNDKSSWYETIEGHAVNRLDDSTFVVVRSGLTLTITS